MSKKKEQSIEEEILENRKERKEEKEEIEVVKPKVTNRKKFSKKLYKKQRANHVNNGKIGHNKNKSYKPVLCIFFIHKIK